MEKKKNRNMFFQKETKLSFKTMVNYFRISISAGSAGNESEHGRGTQKNAFFLQVRKFTDDKSDIITTYFE